MVSYDFGWHVDNNSRVHMHDRLLIQPMTKIHSYMESVFQTANCNCCQLGRSNIAWSLSRTKFPSDTIQELKALVSDIDIH
jgi:hypothetical protein